MAYLKDLFDLMNQKQSGDGLQNSNPMLSAASTQIDTSKQGSGAPAPRQAGSGTGYLGGTRSNKWTNVQDFLAANPSISNMAQNKGNEFMTGEKNAFNQAAQPLRDAKYDPTKFSDNEVWDLLKPEGAYDVEAVRKGMTQDYTGPMNVDFDPSRRENIYKTKMLADRNTAMDVLAEPNIKKGSYGLGLRTLDSTLLGADPNYGGVSTGLNKDLQNFLQQSSDEVQKLGAKATGFKKAAEDARNQTTSQVKNYADTMTKGLGTMAAGQNQAASEQKKDWLKAYTDWYTNVNQRRAEGGYPVPAGSGREGDRTSKPEEKWMGGYLEGADQATPWNVGSDNDYTAINNANSLLGLNPVSRQGTFGQPKEGDSSQVYQKDGTPLTPQELAGKLGMTIEDIGGIPEERKNYYDWINSYYDDKGNFKDINPSVQKNPQLAAWYAYLQNLGRQQGQGGTKRPNAMPVGGR